MLGISRHRIFKLKNCTVPYASKRLWSTCKQYTQLKRYETSHVLVTLNIYFLDTVSITYTGTDFRLFNSASYWIHPIPAKFYTFEKTTPYIWVILETPEGNQLTSNFLAFIVTEGSLLCFQGTAIYTTWWIQSVSSHPVSLGLILYTPRSLNWTLSFAYSNRSPATSTFCPMHATCRATLILLALMTLIILGEV